MNKPGVLDLSDQDFEIVRQILMQYVPDRPIFVFGSRATGRAKRRSDLDLAIAGDQPISMRLQRELAEAFDESDLPIEVDIVDVNEVSDTFHNRIMSEWIEITSLLRQPVAERKEVLA